MLWKSRRDDKSWAVNSWRITCKNTSGSRDGSPRYKLSSLGKGLRYSAHLRATTLVADDRQLASAVLGIYFSCWAIRYKAGLDYKLSRRAQVIRWSLVALAYAMIHLPGPGMAFARVTAGFVGLAFLCWPNLAYRLDRLLFRDWPRTRGIVEASQIDSAGNWRIQYSFDCNGERRGGTDRVRLSSEVGDEGKVHVGSSIAIRYDPLNPTESRVTFSTGARSAAGTA